MALASALFGILGQAEVPEILATVEDSIAGYLNDSYQWSFDGNLKTPLLKDPGRPEFKASPAWTSKFNNASTIIKMQDAAAESAANVQATIQAITGKSAEPAPEARSLEDYLGALVDNAYNVPVCRDIDPQNQVFMSERAFAEYRLSGPNPMSIRLASAVDLINLVPELKGDREINNLVARNQLFIVDHSQLVKLRQGKQFVDGVKKANFGSVGIFKQEGNRLATVGVKLISPSGRTKLFRPEIGLRWEIAKYVFNSNDTFHTQTLMHFARGHRVAEIFVVATYRRFRVNHPLFKLLAPHLEGTVPTNISADARFVGDEGALDYLASYDLEDIKAFIVKFVADFTSTDMRFPEHIKARRMDSETVSGLSYAFRDDGMPTWNAIHKWVESYIRVFYPNDHAVARDLSITNWIEELRTTGGITWLNGFDNTVNWLIKVIASFICLVTVDHASVNYTQRPYSQFAPSFSLGIYTDDAVIFKDDPTLDDFLSIWPPLEMARAQAESNYLLSSFVYGRLGQYSQVQWCTFCSYFKGIEGDQWIDIPRDYLNRVNAALLIFQTELDGITAEIALRNEIREFPYTVLSPENLPQSINL